jgi:hypothetical protein
MASNPVANTMASNSNDSAVVSMPDSVMVEESDVGEVEGGEVVGVEAGSLGAHRVVGRAQGLGCRRVVDDLANLPPAHLGHDGIRRRIDGLVGEDTGETEQLTPLPCPIEAIAADLVGGSDPEDLGHFVGHSAT